MLIHGLLDHHNIMCITNSLVVKHAHVLNATAVNDTSDYSHCTHSRMSFNTTFPTTIMVFDIHTIINTPYQSCDLCDSLLYQIHFLKVYDAQQSNNKISKSPGSKC